MSYRICPLVQLPADLVENPRSRAMGGKIESAAMALALATRLVARVIRGA